MTVIERARRSGLGATTARMLLLALALAVLHHADHVLRVDHSGWPFRPDATPFTVSLLAYPVILFALFGALRLFWWRWLMLALGTAFTILAHIDLETPAMQFVMWAQNRSLDPQAAGMHNLPNVQSPAMGALAVAIGMALNVTAVLATIGMLRDGIELRPGAPS
jgi:hypothetical protein